MNPLHNATIVSVDTDPAIYLRNEKRGAREFVMSRSELAEFNHCPARWIAGFKKKDDTDALAWGSIIDCLMTATPGTFSRRYAVCPETYTNKKGEVKPWNNNADACQEWNETQEESGKEVLKS